MKSRINDEILRSFREFVTTHDYRNTPILTACIDVDPTNPDNQRKRPAWLIELKDRARLWRKRRQTQRFRGYRRRALLLWELERA